MEYDVVIAGGGPAGSSCAIILAHHGWRVLLADSGRPQASARFPEMLAPDACRLLVRLGFEKLLLTSETFTPCSGILSFWNPDRPEFVNLPLTRLDCGLVVDRSRFDANLRQVAASAGVDVRSMAKLRFSSARSAGPIRFRLESSGVDGVVESAAAFVLEATGRTAAAGMVDDACAALMYFNRLIAVSLECRERHVTDDWLRIAPSKSGWWYKFGSRSACVFVTDSDLLPKDKEKRADHLQLEWRDVNPCFGKSSELDIRTASIRDARTSCRRVLWRKQWLPLGDAALTLDPLSGSGLSRALRSSIEAASAVNQYLATGSREVLKSFALGVSHELTSSLLTSRTHYSQVAAWFHKNPFWKRRLASGGVPTEVRHGVDEIEAAKASNFNKEQ